MSVAPSNSFRRFSVAEYHRLIQLGILTDEDKLELLDGYLVLKMPRNPPHDARIQKLTRLLFALLPPGWDIRVQLAVTFGESEAEPDITLVRGTADDFESRHPGAADIGLLIEVADTSLDRDREDKGPIYADAGIETYWIVNLVDRQIEVYSSPTGPTSNPTFNSSKIYRSGDSVPFILDGKTTGLIAVHDVLP
jgi:Uma2 family endonuclease